VQEVIFRGQPIALAKPLGDYVVRHILFKVLYPAEFHAQTAIEAAVLLFPSIQDRLDEIEKVVIMTHESALRIIDKKGPLKNPADRDHCLQYMVAVALMKGHLEVKDYEEPFALNTEIHKLRTKMVVKESKEFTSSYFDEEKRSIASSLQIYFLDGSKTEEVVIEYPLGHPRRRTEAWPFLEQKFHHNLSSYYPAAIVIEIEAFFNSENFHQRRVSDLLALFKD
jgi:2-methylcitrate dehydratase